MSIRRYMGTNYKVSIDEKEYTAQEISAMILRRLKEDAEAYLGEKRITNYIDDTFKSESGLELRSDKMAL